MHYHQHIRRVLAGFAATTVIRYITTFKNFARTCEDLDVCILEITGVQAADILVTLQLRKREDPALGPSAVTCIKAIRWVRRHAQCSVFEVFFGGLISSFLRSTLPKDRCESVPLPLFALVQWERRILQRNTPVVDVILLGAILVTIWASLRFSDSQRVECRLSLLKSCLCGGSRTRLRSRTRASLSALSRQVSCTTAATPGLQSGSGFLIRWPHLKFGILGLPLVSSSPPWMSMRNSFIRYPRCLTPPA